MERNKMFIEMDGRQMTDRATTHDYLKVQLSLPEYYGRNLDALYDLLTECREPRTITLHHTAEMTEQLGPYAQLLLKTLRDAAEKNPTLTVTIL